MSTAMQPHSIHRFDPETDALSTLMPAGEVEIMRLVWEHGPLGVGAIYHAIKSYRPITYSTITTQCYKLAKKGLLQSQCKTKDNRFAATITERELVAQRLNLAFDVVAQAYPDVVAQYVTAHFAQV